MTTRLPIQVCIFCVRQYGEQTEFLLLKRVEERGGFWQGVTGAPEVGESLEDAALRELWEETKLVPHSMMQTDISYSYGVEPQWKKNYAPEVRTIDEYVFLADIDPAKKVTISDEHSEYRWCKEDEAQGLLHWEKNRSGLEHCARLVHSRQPTES